MKLEFLDDISEGGKYPLADPNQLIRLYDFDKTQADKFQVAIQKTILNENKQLDVGELNFIEPVNCNLILRISNKDRGITTQDKQNFLCDLTTESYNHIVYLLEPFRNNNIDGYQWLYDIDTPIDFLFSPGGTW